MRTNQCLIIRTDASEEVGAGHLMRMLALAQAWRCFFGEVYFALSECPKLIGDRLSIEQFSFIHFKEVEIGSDNDSEQLAKFAVEKHGCWIVLDGYSFSYAYQNSIKSKGFSLMVVDDYCYSEKWNADLILNQNPDSYGVSYDNKIPDATILRGASFVLMRQEFERSISKYDVVDAVSGPVRTILVTFGGGDTDNWSLSVLKVLEKLSDQQLEVTVLIGQVNPHKISIEEFAASSWLNVTVLNNVQDMPQLILRHEGIISAGGSSCYEWLALKRRGLVLETAPNQRVIVNWLGESKLAQVLDRNRPEEWINVFRQFIADEPPLTSIGVSLPDGLGAKRVVAQMVEGLWWREAELTDCELYFRWINDPEVRRHSLNGELIEWSSHQKWFSDKVNHRLSRLFVFIGKDNIPVGQVRLDWEEGHYILGYSVDAAFRKKGVGSRMMRIVLNLFKGESIHAVVKDDNIGSLKCLRNVGFSQSGESGLLLKVVGSS